MELTLRDMPFRQLVLADPDLVELRQQYAGQPAAHRRKAALWEYESRLASDLFAKAMARVPGHEDLHEWEDDLGSGAVVALAIDPKCAPAMLTVGSVEYQLARPEEAMVHFLALAALPARTKDLSVIIDEAGEFLLSQKDYTRAQALYAEAARRHPEVAVYYWGLGYCEGKLGNKQAAVDHARRAVELAPGDYKLLSDLGWALVEAGRYDEAEEVLVRAVADSPDDYQLARGNLEECRRRRRQSLGKK